MAPLLMAVGVFIVGAGLVVGAYLLLAGMPQWLVQRRIQQRMTDVAMPFKVEPSDAVDVAREGTEAGHRCPRSIGSPRERLSAPG